MLDNSLENNIKNRIKILSILHLKNPITTKELSELSNIKIPLVKTTIDELSEDLHGLADISKSNQNLEIIFYDGISSLDLFHAVYQNSLILNCLNFLLTNETNLSFQEFAESHFLTRPSAYRIRQSCVDYLNAIGLDVEKNYVIGDEYRIRFLIALMYYKYGFNCSGIDDTSIQIAREFIVKTNNKIDLKFLEYTSSEYGYFEALLVLSWKRKNHPVHLQNANELEALKQLFVYPYLKKSIIQFLEPNVNISFNNEDFDYIFLAYCCANSCVFADKWKPNDFSIVSSLLFSNEKYKDLVLRFSNDFSKEILKSRAFRAILVYFLKNCLLDLHCIIPDKHYYLDLQHDPFKNHVLNYVSDLLSQWKIHNNIPYPIDKGHIQYLTIQIASIAQQFMKPIEVVIVTDLIAEVEVMTLYLQRAFSQQRISIRPVIFDAEDISFIYDLNNCVIITKKVFYPALSAFKISNKNIIVPINIEINELDRTAISKAIIQCEYKTFNSVIFKKI